MRWSGLAASLTGRSGRPNPRRQLLLIAGIGILINLSLSFVVRRSLPVSHEAAGWLLRPLVMYGHTEHVVPRISLGTSVAVAAAVLLTTLAPQLRQVPLMLSAGALSMAGALANALESLAHGSAADYLAFRHVPSLSTGVYNLPDLEILLALLLGAASLAVFAVRKRSAILHGAGPLSHFAE